MGESKEVKCPFYKDETAEAIRCEGTISVACANNFRGREKKQSYKKQYCNTKYKDCEHYKAVAKKYDG